MTQEEIARIFHATFNGQKNMMTPNLITYGSVPGYVYEISSGEGFRRETIYGVTILTKRGERTKFNQGGFMRLEDAKYYVKHFYKEA